MKIMTIDKTINLKVTKNYFSIEMKKNSQMYQTLLFEQHPVLECHNFQELFCV